MRWFRQIPRDCDLRHSGPAAPEGIFPAMKYEDQHRTSASARPAWTYSVQTPRTLSLLWVLERLASLSIPIALIALMALASHFGLATLQ